MEKSHPTVRKARQRMSGSDDSDVGDGKETPDSAASYIASITHELAKMARRNGLDALGYILEMARMEADQAAKD
jgi:hypothetical protein